MHDQAPKEKLSGLVSTALDDIRSLALKTAVLLREYSASAHKMEQTRLLLIAGAAAVGLSAILLCEMIVQLFAWARPDQPVWIAYAGMGLTVLAIGAGLIVSGRRHMKALDPLREQSAAVARGVSETVEDVGVAVDAARESFRTSADSVREALDLHEQFNKRPWSIMAGAVSLGYLGGAVLRSDVAPRHHINTAESDDGTRRGRRRFAEFLHHFEPEIIQLERLALGALFGIARDLVTKSAPEPMESEVEEVMDGITVKLGGTPVRGRVPSESSGGNGASHAKHSPGGP